jgi:hypothetical protein
MLGVKDTKLGDEIKITKKENSNVKAQRSNFDIWNFK